MGNRDVDQTLDGAEHGPMGSMAEATQVTPGPLWTQEGLRFPC